MLPVRLREALIGGLILSIIHIFTTVFIKHEYNKETNDELQTNWTNVSAHRVVVDKTLNNVYYTRILCTLNHYLFDHKLSDSISASGFFFFFCFSSLEGYLCYDLFSVYKCGWNIYTLAT